MPICRCDLPSQPHLPGVSTLPTSPTRSTYPPNLTYQEFQTSPLVSAHETQTEGGRATKSFLRASIAVEWLAVKILEK